VGDLEVYIRCDGCSARSRDIWTKAFDGNVWPLSLCGHDSRTHEAALLAQGFVRMDCEPLSE
jgi:hypothetical protein